VLKEDKYNMDLVFLIKFEIIFACGKNGARHRRAAYTAALSRRQYDGKYYQQNEITAR